MNIKTKFYMVLTPVYISSLIVGIVCYKDIQENSKELQSKLKVENQISKILPLSQAQISSAKDMMIDLELLANASEKKIQAYEDMEKIIQGLLISVKNAELKKQIEKVYDINKNKVNPLLEKLLETHFEDSEKSKEIYKSDFLTLENQFDSAVKNLFSEAKKNTIKAGERLDKKNTLTIYLIASILFFSALVCTVFVYMLIKKLFNLLEQEIAPLKSGVKELNSTAENLSESGSKLLDLNSSQAESVAKMVASLDEISTMVRNNNQLSQIAFKLSDEINNKSEKGKNINLKLTKSIEGLSDSNKEIKKLGEILSKIADKTKIIDEIVFQTKLLSFNASVEAERAGEHGRGFAVVAQEVSKLAATSGKASLEISSIVRSSIKESEVITSNNDKKVELCKTIATGTVNLLEEIASGIADIRTRIEEISSASNDQNSGINQISESMTSLNKTTQYNNETAYKNSSESEKLENISNNIDKSILKMTSILFGKKSKIKSSIQINKTLNSSEDKCENVSNIDGKDSKIKDEFVA